MNVRVNFEAILLGCKENKTDRGTYYSIAVDCEGNVGNLSCTKDVYDYVKDCVKYSSYIFEGIYNANYKNLRVTACKM